MEWTKTQTLKFIELWQGNPCLWDNKISDYKNRQKRRDALSQLAIETNTDINGVEKKIISLKTQYNRELKKLKMKSGAGLDDVPKSNWYAFQYLHFLKDVNTPRPSTDSIMITLPETQTEEVQASQYVSSILEDQQLIQDNLPKRSLKRRHDSQSSALNLLKDASNAIINKNKKDDLSIFGEAVAAELREITSKKQRLLLKRNIMDIIYKTKLDLEENKDSEENKDKENVPGPSYSIIQDIEIVNIDSN